MEKQTEVNMTEEQQTIGNRVEFDITLGTKDMSDFLIKHFYGKFAGTFGLTLSAIALILLVAGIGKWGMYEMLVLLLIGLLFTVVQPLQLRTKAATQVKNNPLFKKPIHFAFDEKGITASQDGQSETLPWERVRQVRETSHSILIYISSVNANIIPKKQAGDKLDALKQVIKENIDKSVCHLK